MKELTKEEMKNISGGDSISSTMLNAISRIIGVIYDLGQSLGSFIRREVEDKMCDLK